MGAFLFDTPAPGNFYITCSTVRSSTANLGVPLPYLLLQHLLNSHYIGLVKFFPDPDTAFSSRQESGTQGDTGDPPAHSFPSMLGWITETGLSRYCCTDISVSCGGLMIRVFRLYRYGGPHTA